MGDIIDARPAHPQSAERVRHPIIGLVVLALVSSLLTVVVSVVGSAPAQAASGDFGYPDASLTSFGSATPTASKPESKLWYAGGSWWASMAASSGYHIYRLNRPTNTWSDTGVALDDRSNTRADALWNGTHLFVASHASASSSTTTSSSSPTRLYRYSLSGLVWTKDAGFPVNMVNNSSETFVIDQDGTGRLWGTYTLNSAPYIVTTNGDADAASVSFASAFIPGVSGTGMTSDDVSSVISANGRTTVMWGNQNDDTMRVAYHLDGASTTTWTGAIALGGTALADDHINLKAIPGDAQGRIFAVTKTSRNDVTSDPTEPLIELLVYTATTNTWTSHVVATIADFPTRPILSLDAGADQIHVYFTAPNSSSHVYNGTIYEKTTSLSSPSFASGRGTPVIRDVANATMNNATTTKQVVSAATGEVVLAGTESSPRYWHMDTLGGTSPPPPPVASFTGTPTSGTVPLTVNFTDTSTGTPTTWAWNFGDGGTASTQNASHQFTTTGTFTVTLTATNAGGPSTATTTITVNPFVVTPPVASFTGTPTSGTVPLTVNFTDTSTGTPTTWAWNFGDGGTASTQNASHQFTTTGTFTVTLTATNAGGPSTATTTITVSAPPTWSLRINAGGAVLPGGWTGDLSPVSVYGNSAAAKSWTVSTTSTITTTDASIPLGTPASMFQSARYDGSAGANMAYTVPVPQNGQYVVRLYFAEYSFTAAGKRKFSVAINGTTVLTNFDIFTAAGGAKKGVARAFTISTSGPITVGFTRGNENPVIQGIEVIQQ